jgi:RNA polymerase sigma factor (sigma-70 family)
MDESRTLLEHRDLIRRVVKHNVKFTAEGHDFDDYVSEANIAALKAIRTYREDNRTKLSTYIVDCVRHRLIDMHKHFGCQKYQGTMVDLNLIDAAYNPSHVVFTDQEKLVISEAIVAGGHNKLIKNSPTESREALRLCFSHIQAKLK